MNKKFKDILFKFSAADLYNILGEYSHKVLAYADLCFIGNDIRTKKETQTFY